MTDLKISFNDKFKGKIKSKYKIVITDSTQSDNNDICLKKAKDKSKGPSIKFRINTKHAKTPKLPKVESHHNESLTSPQIHYDVKSGFMLANNYYVTDSTIARIDPTGWLHSEKYDGIRAIWDGVDFFTRNLTRIAAPQWFKDQMPKTIALDGEFFIKRNYFNQTSGFIRKKVPVDYEWKQIKFMVFDIPNSREHLESRIKQLERIVQQFGLPLVFIKQTRIMNKEHLMEMHQGLVRLGAEGSILREPHSRYIPTRTDAILKVKDQSEEDAFILDWDEGKGRNTGKLGALWVRWVDPEDIKKKYGVLTVPFIQFRVGSGFSDIDRCLMSDTQQRYPRNGIVKVGFFGLQVSGKPRHPAFKGLREP